MAYSKFTKKVPIEVQNRSGFNCSHSNSFSAKCGTIMPILVDHLMPNTTVNLDVACEVNLPPAVSDFYGSIEARIEFFFVPYRVLWAGWKYFFVQPPQGGNGSIPSNNPSSIQINYLPAVTAEATEQRFGAGTLADMLGFKFRPDALNGSTVRVYNMLPFVAYHSVYDHFYRDPRITQPLFYPPQNGQSSSTSRWTALPWVTAFGSADTAYTYDLNSDSTFFSLHQRCWDKDYFTNATYAPQAGNASYLTFSTTGGTDLETGVTTTAGAFSISSLRVANALQHFAEINNLAGQREADQQYARFGCYPSDAALDRPLYLGQKRFNVYKRSVYQQSQTEAGTTNPFSGILGNKTSALSGYGEGFLGKFHAKDAGLLMVMFTLVPQATYSTGTRRYLHYSKLADFPEPLLQGVGDQPIHKFELLGGATWSSDSTVIDDFGYTQRYSECRFMSDEVHGKLRDGQDLAMFQLQRTFDTVVNLNTSFLEIPQNYLDQVTTADASVSNYGCWCNAFFDYKKVQPLSAYSIPTLGDPKDTHTVIIDNGGKRL